MRTIKSVKIFSRSSSCLIVMALLTATLALATPVIRRQQDDMPNVIDAMVVETTTFIPEISTVATTVVDATETTTADNLELDSTTRIAETKDSTLTTNFDDLAISSTLETTTTSKPEITADTTTAVEVDDATTAADIELDSVTKIIGDSVDGQRIPLNTITLPPAPVVPSTGRSVEVERSIEVAPQVVTTEAPIEETTERPSSSTAPSLPATTTTTERPTTETSSEPELATSSPPEIENISPPVRSPPKSENVSPAVITTPTTTTTTTEAPTATTSSAPEVPSSSTTLAPAMEPSTSTATTSDERTSEQEKSNDKAPCNHLPSHESEEIQKTFREEITYKNGTIRGKFTYVRKENGDDKSNTQFYSTDSISTPNLLISTVPITSMPGRLPSHSSEAPTSETPVPHHNNLSPTLSTHPPRWYPSTNVAHHPLHQSNYHDSHPFMMRGFFPKFRGTFLNGLRREQK